MQLGAKEEERGWGGGEMGNTRWLHQRPFGRCGEGEGGGGKDPCEKRLNDN